MAARNDTCDCTVIHQDVLDKVQQQMPEDATFAQLHGFFKMFGDNTRLRIMWALGESEMCVCDLAVLLGMTKSAISHQLRTLKEASLVKFRKDGKIAFYSLADDHVKSVLEQGISHIKEL